MRNAIKWAALLLCVLMIAGLFTACGESKPASVDPIDTPLVQVPELPAPTPRPDLKPIELHEVTRSVFYAPQYVACSLGYFADEGLDVRITTSGGSDRAMTALLAGEADFALAGPETAVYVYNEGKADHPVMIAQITKRDGSFLIGRRENPDFTWEDLRGTSVIGGRNGGMPYMTLVWVLNEYGLVAGKDLEVIDSIQFNLMAGAFEGGTGDYVTLFEPTATEFQNAGKGFILTSIGLDSGNIPYTCYHVAPSTLTKDPGTVEAFLRAVYRAQQWLITATDEEIAVAMQPWFPDTSIESLTIVARSYRASDAWKTELEMFEEDYNRMLDVIEFNGLLTGRPPFGEIFDSTLARKVQG
ncbi:MAG: ABC transporter substrate-binding protein [Clostridiales bacterium]|nr:ABC transporter substrate-binding protein [Clostridiales bacterium]